MASDLLELVHKINFENIFIHKRDGRIDGQTPHDDIGRAYASHRAAKTRMLKSQFRIQTESPVSPYSVQLAYYGISETDASVYFRGG